MKYGMDYVHQGMLIMYVQLTFTIFMYTFKVIKISHKNAMLVMSLSLNLLTLKISDFALPVAVALAVAVCHQVKPREKLRDKGNNC